MHLVFLVEAICPPLLYNITSFGVTSVKLQQLKAVGCNEDGKTHCNLYIRCDDIVTYTTDASTFYGERQYY